MANTIDGKTAEEIHAEAKINDEPDSTEVFYDREARVWVLLIVNELGHQINDGYTYNAKPDLETQDRIFQAAIEMWREEYAVEEAEAEERHELEIRVGDDVLNARPEARPAILRVEAIEGDRLRVRDSVGSFTLPADSVVKHCESGWTGDRCTHRAGHGGAHSYEEEPMA